MSSFYKNVFLTFSTRLLSAAFTSLSTILIARVFGPAGKGIFTMVAFLPALVLNFGHLGLGNANTYLISRDKKKTRSSFYNSFWYGLIISCLFISVFSLLYKFSPAILLGKGDIGDWAFYLSLFLIPFILWENFYQGIFVGRQEFKFFNLVVLGAKISLFVGLLLLIAFLKLDLQNIKIAIFYYVLLMALPTVIYTFYFISRFGFPFKFDYSIFNKAINFGLRSYSACLLAFLVLRSDIYLLNYFRGLKYVGWYSVAVGFADGILLIISSITLVLFPKITENQEKGLRITLQVTRFASLFLFCIIFCAFIFSKSIILFLFGEKFIKAILPLYILLPAVYLWGINSFLTQFFASKGYPWISVWIWAPGLIVNIILNILYIPRYGLIAAAFSSLVAYLLTFILHYLYIQKFHRVSLVEILTPTKKEISAFTNNYLKFKRFKL